MRKIKKRSMTNLLDILTILKSEGVDIREISIYKKAEKNNRSMSCLIDIDQLGIDIDKIIEKYNLDPEYPIGERINQIRTYYKNLGPTKLTEEERNRAEELRILERKTSAGKTLEILSILSLEGIDVRKIPMQITKDNKSEDVLLKDIEDSKINVDEIIKKYKLDENYPLGKKIHDLRNAYRGIGTTVMTNEDKKLAEDLGVISKRLVIEDLLETLKTLENEGIDIKLIPVTTVVNGEIRKTLLEDLRQEGIDIDEIIKKYNFSGKYPIGSRISLIRNKYNAGKKDGMPDALKNQAEKLGITEKKSSIEKSLEILELLQSAGVEVRKIGVAKVVEGKNMPTVLSDIKQEKIDIDEVIKKYKLDPNYQIGLKITSLRRGYKGKVFKLTQEQKNKMETLGIERKKLRTEETLEILRTLQDEKIDIKRIDVYRVIDGVNKPTLLKDIKQSGINMEEIIEKYNLDPEYPIGNGISKVRSLYNGTKKGELTEKERKQTEVLGILEKRSMVDEVLTILEMLKAEKVDVSSIKKTKKGKGIVLEDIRQEGIAIESVIEKCGFDRNYPIGSKMMTLCAAYNGSGLVKMTDEDRRRAEVLGIVKIKDMQEEQEKLITRIENAKELKQEAEKIQNREK